MDPPERQVSGAKVLACFAFQVSADSNMYYLQLDEHILRTHAGPFANQIGGNGTHTASTIFCVATFPNAIYSNPSLATLRGTSLGYTQTFRL